MKKTNSKKTTLKSKLEELKNIKTLWFHIEEGRSQVNEED
jgi:hypothetical protein